MSLICPFGRGFYTTPPKKITETLPLKGHFSDFLPEAKQTKSIAGLHNSKS